MLQIIYTQSFYFHPISINTLKRKILIITSSVKKNYEDKSLYVIIIIRSLRLPLYNLNYTLVVLVLFLSAIFCIVIFSDIS